MKRIYREYQRLLSMTEEEVLAEYDDCKADVIKEYECIIDEYEKEDKSDDRMVYDVDPAFSSFLSVNSMFV